MIDKPEMNQKYKLAHLISRRGFTSRRKAEQLIKAGLVLVDGAKVTSCAERFPESAVIQLFEDKSESCSSILIKRRNTPKTEGRKSEENKRMDGLPRQKTYKGQVKMQVGEEVNLQPIARLATIQQTAPRLFLYHKEPGYLVSHKTQEGKKTIFDAINKLFKVHNSSKSQTSLRLSGKAPEINPSQKPTSPPKAKSENRSEKQATINLPQHLTFVGRLDYLSEGLLLLTNSPQLAHDLSQAGIERVYEVETTHLPKNFRSFLKSPELNSYPLRPIKFLGSREIYLDNKPLKANINNKALQDGTTDNSKTIPNKTGGKNVFPRVQLEDFAQSRTLLNQVADKSRHTKTGANSMHEEKTTRLILRLGLFEGKNREIRRIFAAFGMPIFRLVRVSYGPFSLQGIPPGGLVEIEPPKASDLKV